MGNTYEVYGYVFEDRFGLNKPEYYYKEIYRGESFIAALCVLIWNWKKYGCVKLEARK